MHLMVYTCRLLLTALYCHAGSGLQPVVMSEEEEDQEEEATVRLMLVVLNEGAIKGFHEQVLATMHPSQKCIMPSGHSGHSTYRPLSVHTSYTVQTACMKHTHWAHTSADLVSIHRERKRDNASASQQV